MKKSDTLWLAPMLGFTEYHFRNIYCNYFSGIDASILPFVTLVEGRNVKVEHIKDTWKTNNRCSFRLVPQVLGNNSNMFITMIQRFFETGYDEVNWNLGCPSPRVGSHKHGAGLLPYPEHIDKVLDAVHQNSPITISVKLRLGYKSPEDIKKIIPILNRYPLKSICLHPRIGIQMYDGQVDVKAFQDLLPEIQHPVIYNGDICTPDDFFRMKQKCPQIDQWMIGRGIFKDPFLPEKIKGIYYETNDSAKKRFEEFHQALFEAVLKRSFFERNAVNKMKEYWRFFCFLYENPDSIFDKIKICQTISGINDVFCYIYKNEMFMNK